MSYWRQSVKESKTTKPKSGYIHCQVRSRNLTPSVHLPEMCTSTGSDSRALASPFRPLCSDPAPSSQCSCCVLRALRDWCTAPSLASGSSCCCLFVIGGLAAVLPLWCLHPLGGLCYNSMLQMRHPIKLFQVALAAYRFSLIFPFCLLLLLQPCGASPLRHS